MSLLHSWQFLLGISILLSSCSAILQKILMRNTKADAVAYAFFFQIATGLFILLFAFLSGFRMPNLLLFPINTLLMIVFYAAANIFIFKSVALIDASEFTIIYMTRAFWTIFSAVLFLGEKFSLIQALGTVFIALAVILVSLKKNTFNINKGTFFAFLTAVLFGLAFTNDDFLVRHYDVASYLGLAFILPGLGILFYSPKLVTNLRPLFTGKVFLRLTILSFMYSVAAITIYQAYKIGSNAAQIGALNQLTTMITVLLAIIFLKETSNLWKKLLGAILTFIGVVLIG